MFLLKHCYHDHAGWHVAIKLQHPWQDDVWTGGTTIWDTKFKAITDIHCQAWVHAASWSIQLYEELRRVWDGKMTDQSASSIYQIGRLVEAIKSHHMDGRSAMGWFLACGEDWNNVIPPITIMNSLERKYIISSLRAIKEQYTDLLKELSKRIERQFEDRAATAA